MSVMETGSVHLGQIPPGIPAAVRAAGTNMNALQSLPVMDEDDSSLSSSSPEIFDRSSSRIFSKNSWPPGQTGDWRRYGSSESAPSTGISSVCSSIAAEDGNSEASITVIPRKRTADGDLKFNAPHPSHTTPSTTTQQSSAEDVQLLLHVPRKRGRPSVQRPANPETTSQAPKTSKTPQYQVEARPRSSLPSRLQADVFASQCIEAAFASRLDPYALHVGEHSLFVSLLTTDEVTVYLNIRNAILRLWKQNPLCIVTVEEAAGCAKERRFFGLAEVAHRWLMRNGYINFGCIQVAPTLPPPKRMNTNGKQRTVVVVGAGVSGLAAARQLENLFAHEATRWADMGERPPRVVILEGRRRIGGRVFSKPLRSQVKDSLPDDLRNTAEMGAMIVTGFKHGNPLDTIIRGQLGLRYHMMKDALTIYDCDGHAVDERRDLLNTDLYTDVSDRAGVFRTVAQKPETLRGDEELINRGRDPAPAGFSALHLEPLSADHVRAHNPAARRGRRRNAPPGTEKLTGRSQVIEGGSAAQSATRAARDMGWEVREGAAKNRDITLTEVAGSSDFPTLGSVMDEAIKQYQDLIDLTPQDMRLLNWHHANLEYANAAPISWLSLSGHDQDTGNEFEGAHSEVIGGYTQVPRGLFHLPTKLDVRFDKTVESIHYDDGDSDNGQLATKVVCTDGEVIDADEVILTTPLGVLKSNAIDFDPPLPRWKEGAIGRMGFGLLNKVILLYEKPFWDESRDMFGLLNESENRASLDPADYERRRGRFYLIWNASKISGRPMLIALMAGVAAYEAEQTDTPTLLGEVTGRLRGVFGTHVPAPLEVIVTRWKRDPFTRGTYSYVGPRTLPGDYDLMAKPVGNLHFAGEATCGTHPATVHGAFLSGLRVASEVMDAMAGLISVPDPLVGPYSVKQEVTATRSLSAVVPVAAAPSVTKKRASKNIGARERVTQAGPIVIKQEEDSIEVSHVSLSIAPAGCKVAAAPAKSVCASDASFWISATSDVCRVNNEAAITAAIRSQIGERPVKPTRPGVNPFLLFTKARWEECKRQCGQERAPSGRDLVRQTLGKWWKAAGDDVKQPYIAQSQAAQESAGIARREWEKSMLQWDKDALRIRQEYVRGHPGLTDTPQ